MDYCKYHPLVPATYHCGNCETDCCDNCTDEGEKKTAEKCFVCRKEVEFLGTANNVEPFWRRLQESFRYPLKTGALVLIIGVSFLTTVLSYVPFTFFWYLILVGVLLKYCFRCLEKTSEGEMIAPSITTAYEGGLTLILQLIMMMGILGAVIVGADNLFGHTVAGLLAFMIIIGLPAMLIRFALSANVVEALNPINTIRLISTVGLPYGLLLAFLMIMMASIGLISEVIANDYSFLSLVLQSIVSNYYMVVIFHLMGYMIFQYQTLFGYTARVVENTHETKRAPYERLMVNIDIKLKEGEYSEVLGLYKTAFTHFPKQKEFIPKYFDFLIAIRSANHLKKFASAYLDYLICSNRTDQLNLAYKQIVRVCPDYIPNTPELRFTLAQTCKENGDSKSTIKLINGLHKQFPRFEHLGDAYELMAEALDDLPNMGEKAEQCRKLVKKLPKRQKVVSTEKEPKAKGAAAFSSENLTGQTIADQALTAKSQEAIEPSSIKQPNIKNTDDDDEGDLPPIEFV